MRAEFLAEPFFASPSLVGPMTMSTGPRRVSVDGGWAIISTIALVSRPIRMPSSRTVVRLCRARQSVPHIQQVKDACRESGVYCSLLRLPLAYSN